MRRLRRRHRPVAPRRTLISCQKDEGPHLIEWLAYHKAIGFDRFVIGANDCTDGSDKMLTRLHELGEVEYWPLLHRPIDKGPQNFFMDQLNAARIIQDWEWVCWLDLDEFLNIRLGSGHLDDLIGALRKADGIRVNWRFFGAQASPPWPGRQLHADLCRCAPKNFVLGGSFNDHRTFKTFYRYMPGLAINGHGPTQSQQSIAARPVLLGGSGQRLRKDNYSLRSEILRPGAKPARLGVNPRYGWAQINHYFIRHPDLVTLRQQRGRGSDYIPAKTESLGTEDFTDRHSDTFFARYNRTDRQDTSILRHLPAVDAEMGRLLTDNTVRHWHEHARRKLDQFLAYQNRAQTAPIKWPR